MSKENTEDIKENKTATSSSAESSQASTKSDSKDTSTKTAKAETNTVKAKDVAKSAQEKLTSTQTKKTKPADTASNPTPKPVSELYTEPDKWRRIDLKSGTGLPIYRIPKSGSGTGTTAGPVMIKNSKIPTTGYIQAKCLVRGVGTVECFVNVLDLMKNKA